MRGIRISTLSLVMAGATVLFGATPEYFPLAAGNSWLYKTEGRLGKDVQTLEVTGTRQVGGVTYFAVSIFGRTDLVRQTEEGNVVAYNASAGQEEPWLMFAAKDGENFPTAIERCVRAGRVEAREEKFTGPFGEFTNVLHIRFEPSCADAGLTNAWFLPYIGMVRFEMTTIAGPRVYDLVSSKTGVTEVAKGMISTKAALDAASYTADKDGVVNLVARLSVRNTSDRPLVLNFSSGQKFDLNVKNAAGETVYVWSSDKVFIQALESRTVEPGTEAVWTITANVNRLKPGRYSAEAWVTNNNTPPKSYSASVAFEVME